MKIKKIYKNFYSYFLLLLITPLNVSAWNGYGHYFTMKKSIEGNYSTIRSWCNKFSSYNYPDSRNLCVKLYTFNRLTDSKEKGGFVETAQDWIDRNTAHLADSDGNTPNQAMRKSHSQVPCSISSNMLKDNRINNSRRALQNSLIYKYYANFYYTSAHKYLSTDPNYSKYKDLSFRYAELAITSLGFGVHYIQDYFAHLNTSQNNKMAPKLGGAYGGVLFYGHRLCLDENQRYCLDGQKYTFRQAKNGTDLYADSFRVRLPCNNEKHQTQINYLDGESNKQRHAKAVIDDIFMDNYYEYNGVCYSDAYNNRFWHNVHGSLGSSWRYMATKKLVGKYFHAFTENSVKMFDDSVRSKKVFGVAINCLANSSYHYNKSYCWEGNELSR